MSRTKRQAAIRYLLETIDIALGHPQHNSTADDMVASVAGPMLGDDCIPYDRFLGWPIEAVRVVVTTYAEQAPIAVVVEMVSHARERRDWLYQYAYQAEYEATTGHGCWGEPFKQWCAKRKRPMREVFRSWRDRAAGNRPLLRRAA